MSGLKLQRTMLGSIATLLLFTLSGPSVARAQAACQGCDRSMTLSEKEWECLRRKVKSGELGAARTPVVFLSLSQRSCEGATRSIYTEPPTTSEAASRVYRLSQKQAICLAEIARDPALARAPGISIDFAEACPP